MLGHLFKKVHLFFPEPFLGAAGQAGAKHDRVGLHLHLMGQASPQLGGKTQTLTSILDSPSDDYQCILSHTLRCTCRTPRIVATASSHCWDLENADMIVIAAKEASEQLLLLRNASIASCQEFCQSFVAVVDCEDPRKLPQHML